MSAEAAQASENLAHDPLKSALTILRNAHALDLARADKDQMLLRSEWILTISASKRRRSVGQEPIRDDQLAICPPVTPLKKPAKTGQPKISKNRKLALGFQLRSPAEKAVTYDTPERLLVTYFAAGFIIASTSARKAWRDASRE